MVILDRMRGTMHMTYVAVCVVMLAAAWHAAPAYAQSVVWSAVQPDLIAPGAGGPDRPVQYLFDPMVSVSYRVLVSEVDAQGQKIRSLPAGASVAKGTRVLFEFLPHTYQDVYWFGSGGSMGSPYGDWIAPGQIPPPAERCTPKNLYATNVPKSGTKPFVDQYAALAIEPPAKNIAFAGAPATCSPQGGLNAICTLNESGTVSATFEFSPTLGRFYPGQVKIKDKPVNGYCPRYSRSIGDSYYMDIYGGPDDSPTSRRTAGKFVMQVPERTITVDINVLPEDDTTKPPAAPTLAEAGSGSCVVGSPHAISMRAEDPNNAPIRYAIDWDQNGTIDQYAPSTGYVSSGTTQTVSRTYSASGTKSVSVRTFNAAGLSSAWETLSFECAPAPETVGMCADGIDNDGDGLTDDADLECVDSFGYTEFSMLSGYSSPVPQNADSLSIRALPSLVRPGETTRVHWSAAGMVSCSVTGENGDVWDGLASPIVGKISTPIDRQTRYTLRCLDDEGETHSKSAVVGPLPAWTEN